MQLESDRLGLLGDTQVIPPNISCNCRELSRLDSFPEDGADADLSLVFVLAGDWPRVDRAPRQAVPKP
jgi:hypothetical protein